ncbi:MAG TPA: hypothetical protein VNW47_04490 [Terriglobales bacterium]|jgi:hypothetical protein|nr:hypothetical protein [Terriglobales bacterium]
MTPTLAQVRHKWHGDLQLQGLLILSEAAKASRPALYIAMMLDCIREDGDPRSVTYLTEFIMHNAAERGLLGA